MMKERLIKIKRLFAVTMVLLISLIGYSSALEEEYPKETETYMVIEKVTDLFSGENFNILENTKERVEELTDSIGRGSERIGDSIEKLTNLIGFDNTKTEEVNEALPSEGTQENNSTGQVVGTFKTKDGESLGDIRVNLGNYATYTNSNGDFLFDNLPYGVYTLSYQASQNEPTKALKEISIDSTNDRFVVSLVLENDGAGAVLAENDSAQEIRVGAVPEEIPGETGRGEQNGNRSTLLFLFFIMLALLALILFFAINRKHIKSFDGKTGEALGKKKVLIKDVTWIDMTEEFEIASGDKIRVRFIRTGIKKLWGRKVVFTADDQIIAKIPEYTGELDFLVHKKESPVNPHHPEN